MTVEEKPEEQDRISVTHHEMKVGARVLRYAVTCGTLVLHEDAEKDGVSEGRKARASMFFIAYTLEGDGRESRRPITFSFNGGPGSSSVWLHLGVLGPQRVDLDDEGYARGPVGQLVPNEYSLLEASDLVFVDPVGTGYSRMLKGEKVKEYHEHKRDLESNGGFIRHYCSRYGRWGDPKYLIGESYGTMRVTGLAGHLLERYGMYFNGVMLVSCVLDYQQVRFDPGNDLPHVLFLPTYAAIAWFHKRVAPELQKMELRAFLDEVQTFAGTAYARALFLGSALEPDARRSIAARLARYTGVSPEYAERTNLRIEIFRFCKELLREQGVTVGRLDGRYTGVDRDSAGEQFEFDPSLSEILGPYTAAINQYIRNELKFETDHPYETLRPLHESWAWSDFSNRYTSVVETLRKTLAMNPKMRVLVASGYYDLATPYFAADYTLDHLDIPAMQRKNVTVSYYEAGHMMYVQRRSLEKLAAELRRFVTAV